MKVDSTIRVDDQSDELFAVPTSGAGVARSDAGVVRRDLVGPWNVSTAGRNTASHLESEHQNLQ